MIFGYLGVADRLAASIVCKRWYYASLSKNVWRDTSIRIEKGKAEEGQNMLMNCERPFSHVIFQDCDAFLHAVNMSKAIGQQLSVLQFENCSVSGVEFAGILSECPNLQSLKVIKCDALFSSETWLVEPEEIQKLKSTLQSVKKLDFSGNKKLSDTFFTRLIQIFTNVESISLARCPINFQDGVFRGFHSLPGSRTSNGSLTFRCIKEFIVKNAKRITSLSFDSTNIDDVTLKTLAQIEGLQLESISLSPCPLITVTGMTEFCRCQKKLKNLNFHGPVILHHILPEICDNLLELRELHVRSYYPPGKISSFVALKTQSLSKLVKLNLDSYGELLVLKFIDSLRSKAHPRLKHLNLHNDEVDDSDFLYMIPYLQHITYLDLGGTLITDKSLVMISTDLVNLQILRLAQCDGVTDQGLIGHSKTHPALLKYSGFVTALKTNASNVNNENLKFLRWRAADVSQSPSSLSNLKGLRELNLYNIRGITDVGLKVALTFRELRCLYLGGSSKITNEGLSAVGQNNSCLEVLSVRNSKEITENGIAEVLSYLPRLKLLDLRGCVRLREKTLSLLVKRHSFKLKYLF